MSFFEEFCGKYLKIHGEAPAVRTDGVVALLCQEIDVLRVQITYLKNRLETLEAAPIPALLQRIEDLEAKPNPPAGVNDEVES